MSKIIVKNIAHDGYRRAGLSFKKGDNEFTDTQISEAQMAHIKKDPRLSVSVEAVASQTDNPQGTVDAVVVGADVKMVDGVIAGVADADGKVTELKFMKVDLLKALAKDLGITGTATMTKAQLSEAILAVPVQAPADTDARAETDNDTGTGAE
ncbi:Rho termination factor N-terminal domain-containing protein [Shewanella yunxiaonensis]|uniref:Rho termination factor N-terminal domain-containing protein n=1 Tax=Shewanella yunxiaonensis TaxID=2829809 RepID=A0ABX7YUT0_9GAMM|nr:HI1506-related protein [Shewanella yunxiaonensis]QUN06434.1 Rho termination factor N-terminal domain-containing protein [Shewanella yunxiaonensis]